MAKSSDYLKVECPTCGAKPGEKCSTITYITLTHPSRITLARRLGAAK